MTGPLPAADQRRSPRFSVWAGQWWNSRAIHRQNGGVDNYYRIFVNVEELRISLENLLDNSIKAMVSEREKKIHIYITKEEKNLKLYFEDNGIGISKENSPFIFNVSFTTTNGSGIGLSNVLDFMKDEGGDINLLEAGKLKGAAFELTFPIKGGIS